METEKFTLNELRQKADWKNAVVVFKQESFSREYSEESRSYEINRDAKYFDGNMIGNSLFGNCLDGKDDGVRLDHYMNAEKGGWKVEYCYIVR